MIKRLIIFIALAIILNFVIGCSVPISQPADAPRYPAEKPQPVETQSADTADAEAASIFKTPIEPIEKALLPEPNEPAPEPAEPLNTGPVELIASPEEKNDSDPAQEDSPESEPNEVENISIETEETKDNINEPVMTIADKAKAFHDKFAGLLGIYVNENGMVDYGILKRNRLDLKTLMDEFADLEPEEFHLWPDDDKIALWINAYNFQILNVILQNYPVESSRFKRLWFPPTSIRHIDGIWTDYKFIVMDEEFTLAEIEQRFFRTGFDEPRVFFALSRASMSSPPLRNEPYFGNKLYSQLDDQVKKFLASPLAFKIDREKQVVYLSAILEPIWYGQDFISSYGTDKRFKAQPPAVRAVLNFLTGYISQEDIRFLEFENYSVKFMNYDWRLNQ